MRPHLRLTRPPRSKSPPLVYRLARSGQPTVRPCRPPVARPLTLGLSLRVNFPPVSPWPPPAEPYLAHQPPPASTPPRSKYRTVPRTRPPVLLPSPSPRLARCRSLRSEERRVGKAWRHRCAPE